MVFNRLGLREVRVIAGLMLQETLDRAAAKGYEVEVGAALMDFIVREGHSSEYGVRPLRRVSVTAPCGPARRFLLAGVFSLLVARWREAKRAVSPLQQSRAPP